MPRPYEIPLNNSFNFGYHLDISMDVLREGVRAPMMEEVLISNCHYEYLSGTFYEIHPKNAVSLAAHFVRDNQLR